MLLQSFDGIITCSFTLLQISDFYHNLLPVDGIWIDMNEISNFCNGECTQLSDSQHNRSKLHRWDDNVGFDPNNPPYQIDNQDSNAALNVKTLDMDAQHYGGVLVYNAHNIFGNKTYHHNVEGFWPGMFWCAI